MNHPPLVFDDEQEKELWREALLDEGLRPWQIDLIEDNLPVPGLGPSWQPLWHFAAQPHRPQIILAGRDVSNLPKAERFKHLQLP